MTRGALHRSPRPGRLLAGLAVALALVATGCAPGSGSGGARATRDASTPVETDVAAMGDATLTVWDQEVRGGQDEQMKQLNAAFEKAYPNVRIKRVSQSFDDLNTTLRLALTGNDAPDVVQANNARATMGQFVEAGQLIDLDPYAEAYGWRDRYSKSVLALSSYSDDAKTFGDGSLYGLPQVGEVIGVYYSKKKLADLGLQVPTTWKELTDDLGAAKRAGETPMLLGNIEGWPAAHVLGPIQGQHVDPATIRELALGNPGASWTTPKNVAAAQELASWQQQGWFNEGVNGTDYDTAWQMLTQGQGTFLMAGSWLAPDIADAMGDDAGFFVPPPAEEGGPVTTTGGTGVPFGITSAAEQPDLAAAYVDFLTDDDAMKVLADTGNLPVVDTARYAPESGLLSDVYRAFAQVNESGELLPYLDYATPSMGDTLGQSLQGLLAGELSPTETAQALQDDYAKQADAAGSGG